MSAETTHLLALFGLILIVATAALLLIITLVVARLWPRLAWPMMVLSWSTGTAGFVAVSIAQTTVLNIALGALFVISSIYHGMRLRKRAKLIASRARQDNTEAP